MACHNFYMSFATGPMLLHELPWVLLACGPSFSSYSIMLLSLVYHLHTQFAILEKNRRKTRLGTGSQTFTAAWGCWCLHLLLHFVLVIYQKYAVTGVWGWR